MKTTFNLNQIKKYKNPVVAIGVFDGLHRGHRHILEEVVKLSRKVKGTSIALTFWPHPQREESLYSLQHRLRLIAEIGIDLCIVLKFNQAFSRISAQDFIKNILVKRMGIKYLYVGKNFRFGKGAEGGLKILKSLSRRYNFKVKAFPVIKIKGQPISSTAIRKLINQGELGAAQYLLGRPVSVLGTVIKGSALARRLGFPTANINPHHEVIPPAGVYAVKIIFDKRHLKGVCYIGTKPTLRKQKAKDRGQKHIETHIFNFNKSIYKSNLEIEFIQKIRTEQKFASLTALAGQVEKDIKLAKKPHSLH